VALLNIPASRLVASMWELTIVTIIIGAIVGFHKLGEKEYFQKASIGRLKALATFLRLTWYVWSVVILVLIFGIDILPVVACSALIMLFILKKPDRDRISLLKKAFSWKVLTMVSGVIIFKGFLETSGILNKLTSELSIIPSSLLLFAVPFAIGLITGVNAAFVGLGFPILMPYLLRNAEFHAGSFALAYGAGFAGVLLSPVHLCLLLTRQYFNAKWGGIYRFLLPSVIPVLIAAVLIFFLH